MKTFREKMFELSRRLMTEERGSASVPCPPDSSLQSRGYVSPVVSFVTIQKPNNTADADVLLQLPFPARQIICVSRTAAENTNTIFLHFIQLNKNYAGGNAILPVGNEQWLPIGAGVFSAAFSCIGSGWIFKQPLPVQNLYLDMGQESGGTAGPVTFAISNDIDYWRLQTT
jgi:hypothetical protein